MKKKTTFKSASEEISLNDLEWSCQNILSQTSLKDFYTGNFPISLFTLYGTSEGKVQKVQVIDNIMRKCYSTTFIQYEISSD